MGQVTNLFPVRADASTGQRSMVASHYAPSEALKPFVRTFLIIASDGGTTNRLLPDTSLVMAFRLRGRTQVMNNGDGPLARAVLSGIMRTPRLMRYVPGTAMLLTLFRPGGAAAFFRAPMHAFKGGATPLEDLLGRALIDGVEARLDEAHNDRGRIAVVEEFLLAQLDPARMDARVQAAVQRIRQHQGSVRIGTLAGEIGLSVDAFEKRFRAVTGTSPKHFADIVRFRALLARRDASKDLFSMAYDGGFYDQSHFIAAFKRFTGMPPREFFAQGAYW